MMRLEELLNEFQAFMDREDLEDFIARGWVKPNRDEKDFVFEDIDVARIRLVYELRTDMDLHSDGMDIVLSLMDQLYETRARLNLVSKALNEQPDDIRNEVLKTMKILIK